MFHLARRFFFSLRPGAVDDRREAWLMAKLTPAEADLYRKQARADRVHSLRCAEVVAEALGDSGSDAQTLIVASALHDVGKTSSGLGTFARVGATILDKATSGQARRWAAESGWRGRIGAYIDHDRSGAELLRRAGSHPTVIAWAHDHHASAKVSSLDADVFALLRRADHS